MPEPELRVTRLQKFVDAILGDAGLVIVDVGAAYGLPPHLAVFESSAHICLFEPEAERARELQHHYAAGRRLTNVAVFAEALAANEGERTLYVTNVPTGSSLLKPGSAVIEEFGNHGYFFPIREIKVRTRALADVLVGASIDRVDAIKLDVQGAEIEVLRGLRGKLAETTLAVELEVGMPGAYLGQPGLGAVDEFMDAAGFRLYDLRLVRHHRVPRDSGSDYSVAVFGISPNSTSIAKRVAESDALYFRKPEVLLERKDVAAVRRLVALMCAYGQFIEAYDLVCRAEGAGLIDADAARACRDSVIGWHRATVDSVAESRWFALLVKLASRVSKGLQRRLLGKSFVRWQE